MTGLSTSTISAFVCEKRGGFPLPVEQTVTGPGQAPARGRRWIPAQIIAHRLDEPIPFIAPEAPPKRVPDRARNVFLEICSSNAEVSP